MIFIINYRIHSRINRYSSFSHMIDGEYNPEFLAYIGEEIGRNYIDGYTPVVLINETNKNIVTIKCLFSTLKIDGGIQCMLISLHPKFAITLVPNDYYKKMIEKQGEEKYLKIDDEKNLLQLNKQLYYFAKYNEDDVIG